MVRSPIRVRLQKGTTLARPMDRRRCTAVLTTDATAWYFTQLRNASVTKRIGTTDRTSVLVRMSLPQDQHCNGTSVQPGIEKCRVNPLCSCVSHHSDEYNRKPETFSCVEECCPKYEEPLSTLYNLRNHNQSAVHRAAENKRAYFESIRTVIGRAIHERMEAFQHLICDVPNCPDFQKQWSTAASFVKHADTEMHQSYDKAFEEALTSGPEKLAKLERESRPFECHRKRCEGHGQRFRTKTEYHGHCSSTSHTEATTDVPPRRPQTPKLVR